MTLPLRIRELRQERGLTLAELAEKCSISTAHMSQVERGIKNLNNHLLERLSEALGVPPYALILPESNYSGLHSISRRLNPQDQERLIDFARALLESEKGA